MWIASVVAVSATSLGTASCGGGGPTIRNEQMTEQEALGKLQAEPTEDGINHRYVTGNGDACEVENVLVGQDQIDYWVDAGEPNVLDLGNGIGIDFVAEDEKSRPCIDTARERLG
jgi:hypothetical protein